MFILLDRMLSSWNISEYSGPKDLTYSVLHSSAAKRWVWSGGWVFLWALLDNALCKSCNGKVERWKDKMNRLHVLHYYRLKEHHESWKVKVWKERQIFFHFPDQKIDSKYLEFNFFRLWLHFFAIRGCLQRKCIKQILLRLSRQIFWDQSWPLQTPPSCFLHFPPLFPLIFFLFLLFLDSWGV